ncbi:DDE-type integrase/transposase/recombinase [Luteococcus sediminum]
MELELAQRKAILASQVSRWPKATRQEKSEILDAICHVTGWHRDHARKMIRQRVAGVQPGSRKRREPVLTYDQAVIEVLVRCWVLLDGPTGKRLQPALPQLVESLRAHNRLEATEQTIEALLRMSPATIDRRLQPYRAGLVAAKGMSHTRPGSMLKASIPMKTWAEWDQTEPGFVQIDLVGHEGGDNNGQFHWSLDMTDIATGWTEAISVHSKGERIVRAGLEQLQLRFPFAIMGIHSDNGSEFINHHLQKWCALHQITYTRGRPARSNDQAHVEQKNWAMVRRCVGYHRYDTARELTLLNQLWELESTMTNMFIPQQKLVSKTRVGAKVTKRYDTATTPYQRLLRDHPTLIDEVDRRALEHRLTTADPVAIRQQIALIQANLLELARRRGQVERKAKRNAVYLSRTKLNKRAS